MEILHELKNAFLSTINFIRKKQGRVNDFFQKQQNFLRLKKLAKSFTQM